MDESRDRVLEEQLREALGSSVMADFEGCAAGTVMPSLT